MKIKSRIFRTFLLVSAISFISFSIFIGKTILEIPFKRLTLPKVVKLNTTNVQKLERDSVVKLNELKVYYLASTEKASFKSYIESKTETKTFNIERNKVLINFDTDIGQLRNNSCPSVYCIQFREKFSALPSSLWKGLLGVEDIRFLDHPGIDFKSIMRALVKDIKALKFIEGGSTITQQLIKNLFLTNEKSLIRKLKEVIYAVYLEAKLTKEEILQAYFNEINWGSLQGIRLKGVFAASLGYFQKKPSDLSEFESAILISLLKGPYFYHPIKYTDRLKSRVAIVRNLLINKGFYNEESEVWSDKKWKNWVTRLKNRNNDSLLKSLWKSINNTTLQARSFEKFIFIHKGEKILKWVKDKVGTKNFSLKIYMNRPFQNKSEFKYYSSSERSLDKAIEQESHNVGSTLKPLLYQIYQKFGYSMDSEIDTSPITLKLKSGKWTPRESHRPSENIIPLYQALMESFNTPIIKIAQEIGFEKIQESLIELIPNLKVPLGEYPAQLLGAVELSVKEIYLLYKHLIKKECEKTGVGNSTKLLDALSDPTLTTIRRVVKGSLSKMKFFGKTGTSNSGRDNWFVFFDGVNLGAIWIGFEGPYKKKEFRLFGGSTSFRVFQEYFNNRGKRFIEFSCPKI